MLYKARASCQAGDSGYMIIRAIRCKKEIFSCACMPYSYKYITAKTRLLF